MTFANVYEDTERARAYAELAYPGTYYLAYRDLPALITAHVTGARALDFGCGAGRSTRFLQQIGFSTIGIDISASMIALARGADPQGTYHLVEDGDFSAVAGARFDLILSAFAFDNIPGTEKRRARLRGLGQLLDKNGRIVVLGSTPDIYLHEWASFTTREFPQNRHAKSGEMVQIVMKDVADSRPVVDQVWFHQDYLDLFAAADLTLLAHHLPLGRPEEPIQWLSETTIAPWMIYVLGKAT